MPVPSGKITTTKIMTGQEKVETDEHTGLDKDKEVSKEE